MTTTKLFILAFLLLATTLTAQMAQQEELGKTEFKTLTLADKVFDIQATQISDKAFSMELAGEPLADFEVKNLIDNNNQLIDCSGGFTCDFTIELTPKMALAISNGDISGGWFNGTARVEKIFYPTMQEIPYIAENETRYYSSPYEETDFSTLQKSTDEKVNITIRFARDELKPVDIFPIVFGQEFRQFSIWGIGGTEYNMTLNGVVYTVHVFTSTGVFNATSAILNSSILAIGGGGGGGTGAGGGGGAGGMVYIINTTIPLDNYTITIGAGGTATNTGTNTTFWNITALGGGASPAGAANPTNAGKDGGSGGGAGSNSIIQGSTAGGTALQPTFTPTGFGFNGGATPGAGSSPSGGGGGAGAAGQDGQTGAKGGDGGIGKNNSINGSAVCYAGGGAGASGVSQGTETGGCGGGNVSQAGTNGKGGGGGSGATGGNGIVIIMYPAPPALNSLVICTGAATDAPSINYSFFDAYTNASISANLTASFAGNGTLNGSGTTVNVCVNPVNFSIIAAVNETVIAPGYTTQSIQRTAQNYSNISIARNFYLVNATFNQMFLCNASSSSIAIHYTFYDISTLASINASLNAVYTAGNASYSATLTNNTVNVCVNPSNFTVAATAIESINATGYYGVVNTVPSTTYSNSTISRAIPLTNISSGAFYTIQVQSSTFVNIQGATIVATHFLTANNTWVGLQTTTTDSLGTSVFFLVPGNLYNFYITAPGFNPKNSSFVAASSTTQAFQLTTNITPTQNVTTFNIWGSTGYLITPAAGYYNSTQTVSYQVASNTSQLVSYGMYVIKTVNNTITTAYNTTGTNPNGDTLTFAMTPSGTYVAYAWFKSFNTSNFTVAPVYYFITNQSTGLARVREELGNALGGWTFYFLSLCISIGAGIAVSQFLGAGSGASGLAALACLTFLSLLAPPGMFLFGGFVTPIIATVTIGIGVIGVVYVTSYGV